MKRLILTALLTASPALAQTPPSVSISQSAAQAIVNFLHNGGTRNEADALASQLIDDAAKPGKDAADKKRLDDAVAAARADEAAKARKPLTDPSPGDK